ELAGRIRDVDVEIDPQRCQQGGDLRLQRVEPEACQGADETRAGDGRRRGVAVAGGSLDEIGLVERNETWLVPCPELVEDRLDGRPVLAKVRVRRVDDLDEDVGSVDLLE